MKRFVILGLVLAILAVGFTAFADPIGVGGMLTCSARVETFPGKGEPQGRPFTSPIVSLQSTPIGVGGM